MAHKNICEKTLSELYELYAPADEETAKHLEECSSCRAEYQKLCTLRSLLKDSAPDVPKLRDAVTARIAEENIAISAIPAKSRRRIPLGTIAAAAAILAVYAAVYGLRTPDGLFSKTKNLSADCNESATEEQLVYDDAGKANLILGAENGAEYKYSLCDSDIAAESECEAEAECEDGEDGEEGGIKTSEPESAANTALTNGISDSGSNPTEDAGVPMLTARPKTNDASYGKEEPSSTEASSEYSPILFSDITQSEELHAEEAEMESYDNTDIKNKENEAFDDLADSSALRGSGGSSSGGSSSGGSSSSSVPKTAAESARLIFEAIELTLPERISREVFESIDPQIYLDFVGMTENLELEYTEAALIAFADSYGTQN